MRLLDCGAGPGAITYGLAEAVAPSEVVGIVLSQAQVDRARDLANEFGVTNVRFEAGSVYELPFPDASFDVTFAHADVEWELSGHRDDFGNPRPRVQVIGILTFTKTDGTWEIAVMHNMLLPPDAAERRSRRADLVAGG